MKLYDITQEVFSCKVFPGDPAPAWERPLTIERGAVCNLTTLSMCAHNGTHIDAPYHFFREGKTVEQLPLETFVGDCFVARHAGPVTGADAEAILARSGGAERLLIAGDAVVTLEAARVFADAKLLLVGNESQTVGPEDAPMAVHLCLLGSGVVLLEGLVLKEIREGRYLLNAAPLNLAGSDGAPCRARLMEA